MTTERIDLLTPVGRLVQGSPFEPQTTDAEGRPLVIKTGPNTGQPRVDYFMAIAIPKTDPGWPELWAKIQATAKRDFPSLFDAAGACINPAFAFKVVDGDSTVPNQKGILPSSRIWDGRKLRFHCCRTMRVFSNPASSIAAPIARTPAGTIRMSA